MELRHKMYTEQMILLSPSPTTLLTQPPEYFHIFILNKKKHSVKFTNSSLVGLYERFKSLNRWSYQLKWFQFKSDIISRLIQSFKFNAKFHR